MIKPSNTESTGVDATYLPVLRLWILRALLRCNGVEEFIGERRFDDQQVARLLGYTDAQLARYNERWALKSLQARLDALERASPPIPTDTVLAGNLAKLSARLGLNDVERDILHFTALQRVQSEFCDALDQVGELTRASTCRLLAQCLGHPVAAIQAALDDRGKLSRSALLSVDPTRVFRFCNKVDMLTGLAEDLMLEHDDLLSLFGTSIVPARVPRLTLAHFPHLAEDITLLQGYLTAAGRLQQPGVNVLVHGRPGTGKTEFG